MGIFNFQFPIFNEFSISKFIIISISILVLGFRFSDLGFGAGEAALIRVNAQEMRSQNFIINGGNFNMTSGQKASQNFKLADVVGQTAAGTFLSKGYSTKIGYLNTSAGDTFSFSISPSTADFGILTPNNPVDKTLKITVSNGNATGYSVRLAQNQPLSTLAGAEIPDTLCDGSTGGTCSMSQAAIWNKNTSYGFGYRITGRTVPQDFSKDSYFRQFPTQRRNDPPVLIMQSSAKKVLDEGNMKLRVNIGHNQPVGQYRNVLIFSALVGV